MRKVIVVLFLLLIAGISLGLTAYPMIHGASIDQQMVTVAREFDARYTDSEPQEASTSSATASTTEYTAAASSEQEPIHESDSPLQSDIVPGIFTELRQHMQQYNETLFASGQSGMIDPWSLQEQPIDLSAYGISDGVIGTITIPAMELELPIYLGATTQNFLAGAALLSQTSFPIGGTNTNAVIAAHRGYNGGRYFRDIEVLQPGDKVYLTNFWDTLTYEVVSLELIQPNDVAAIKLQPGRDLLTLMTCHPYIGHRYRYLVYCERCADATINAVPDSEESIPPEEALSPAAIRTDTSSQEPADLLNTESCGNDTPTNEANDVVLFESSRNQIWMDRYLPLILVGVFLMIITIAIGIPMLCTTKRQ